jgi:energy-coupling factor transporter ATP-binding protein EcfA2
LDPTRNEGVTPTNLNGNGLYDDSKHLNTLRIFNCFGFGDATVNLQPDLVYVLGRNSSGKTALLDAVNSLALSRIPRDHPRFTNFRPTSDENPRIRGTFVDVTPPVTIELASTIQKEMVARNLPSAVIAEHFRNQFAQINESYNSLLQSIGETGTFTLTKFPNGECQLTVGDDFTESGARREEVNKIIKSLIPGGILTLAGTRYENVILTTTAAVLDKQLAGTIMPPLAYYNEQYQLTADLPDYITPAVIGSPPNGVTRAFITLLGPADISTLLATNDPDEQDDIRTAVQSRANELSLTISKDSNRLVQITLSLTSNGIQITLRTDNKKSFYRHLSDATKFLIAYHVHAQSHEPGAILLFDEPSRGLHASAEVYLREFLQRLAKDNHVIVSTHSERLIDLERLDGIRLMQQDENDRLIVLNKLRPPQNQASYLLALLPVFDAIGLTHTHQTLTQDHVVLTEGLTDYLYLRALHELTGTTSDYGVAPGRGEGTLFTLVPFMASQGVSVKIVIDHPGLMPRLQEAYGLPESVFFVIPSKTRTRGIEDIFTPADYLRILAAAGYDAPIEDLTKAGNSAYAKETVKRLVAQTFRDHIAEYSLSGFEQETRANITSLLDFCANDSWFKI